MGKAKILIYVVVVLALLGGAGYLYWDDISPLFYEYIGPLVGMEAPEQEPADNVNADDADANGAAEEDAGSAADLSEYEDMLPDMFNAFYEQNAANLLGGPVYGFAADIASLTIDYPDDQNDAGIQDIDFGGSIRWKRSDSGDGLMYRLEMDGAPWGQVVSIHLDGEEQVAVTEDGQSYTGDAVIGRILNTLLGSVRVVPLFDVSELVVAKATRNDGELQLRLRPVGEPNGFYSVKDVELTVLEDSYFLEKMVVRYYEEGELKEQESVWEESDGPFLLETSLGTWESEEAADDHMVLVTADGKGRFEYDATGDLPAISIEIDDSGVMYSLTLNSVEFYRSPDEVPGDDEFSYDAAETTEDAGPWAAGIFGWSLPASIPAPAPDEEEFSDEEEGGESVAGEAELDEIREALEAYFDDNGEYPETAEIWAASVLSGDYLDEDRANELEKMGIEYVAEDDLQDYSLTLPAAAGEDGEATSEDDGVAQEDDGADEIDTVAESALDELDEPVPDAIEEPEPEEVAEPEPTPTPEPEPAPVRRSRPQPQRTTESRATQPPATAPATTAAPSVSPYQMGVRAYREGRLQAAERYLKEQLRRSPNHDRSNYLLGYIYYTRGLNSAAREHLLKVIAYSRDTQLVTWSQQLLQRIR